MSRNSRGAVRWSVLAGATAAALILTGIASEAEVYVDVPMVRSGQPAAIGLDPDDPVPQIGWRACHSCARGHGWDLHHDRHEREEREEWLRHHRDSWHDGAWPGPDRSTAIVDCSGRSPHTFHSVSEAAQFTPPNGRILIVPPDPGMTCVETVRVRGPVTIASAGPGPAIIQAPAGQPCLVAQIPLGDRLIVENVAFIARGKDEPCVQVEAGAVALHNVHVDSRNTEWAFDVGESGNLMLAESRIETDGSGVRAIRANVQLSGVEIDVEEGHDGVGLALDRTDGEVDNTQVLGGLMGAVVSGGPHGLSLSRLTVSKAITAMIVRDGEQGVVHGERLTLTDNHDGVVVMPHADAKLEDLNISRTRAIGVTIYGGRVALSASRINGAATGVALVEPGHAPEGLFARVYRLFHHEPAPPLPPGPGLDGPTARSADITGNTIANTSFAGIDLLGGPARVEGNTIYFRRGECILREHRDFWDREHDNSCHEGGYSGGD